MPFEKLFSGLFDGSLKIKLHKIHLTYQQGGQKVEAKYSRNIQIFKIDKKTSGTE
jgi:hypothetical protein